MPLRSAAAAPLPVGAFSEAIRQHKYPGLRGRFPSYESMNGRQNLRVPTCRLHKVAGRKGWK